MSSLAYKILFFFVVIYASWKGLLL
uniref:Uncharacterized protein n=1 Tax=Arundo donax TaxID=35708 RepID=A0A0A8Z648_ARUDO